MQQRSATGILIDGSDAWSREVGQSRGTSALVHQSGPALGRAVNASGPCARGSNAALSARTIVIRLMTSMSDERAH
jgi:hypothetical protein